MRPSIRFAVFKRDGFTCVYCGRTPPDVTLEIDHVIPRAEGGGDESENLVTSCWDCNRGKGATSLEVEPQAMPDIEERTALIREREYQLRAYNEAVEERRAREEAEFLRVWEHWYAVWDATELPRWHVPWESTLRRYIDELGVEEVLDAMDIARRRFRYLTTNAVRYFVGVLRRKAADRDG